MAQRTKWRSYVSGLFFFFLLLSNTTFSTYHPRLCNACGLHYAKQLRKEKHASKKKRKTSIESILNKDKQTVTVTATPSAAAAAAIAHQSEKKSPVSGDDLGDSTT